MWKHEKNGNICSTVFVALFPEQEKYNLNKQTKPLVTSSIMSTQVTWDDEVQADVNIMNIIFCKPINQWLWLNIILTNYKGIDILQN